MNTTELINQVSEETGITKKDVKKIVHTTLEIITEQLKMGEKCTFRKYFTIRPHKVKRHKITLPQSNKQFMIKTMYRYTTKIGKK